MTMSIRRSIASAAIALVSSIASVEAAELTGAWSTDRSACSSLFSKRGNTIEFAKGAGIVGTGFIVAGDKITGQMAACNIRAQRKDGAMLHLITACSDDVALSTNQFTLKIVNDNEIVRLFPAWTISIPHSTAARSDP